MLQIYGDWVRYMRIIALMNILRDLLQMVVQNDGHTFESLGALWGLFDGRPLISRRHLKEEKKSQIEHP